MTTGSNRRVLIIDDDRRLQKRWKKEMGTGIFVRSAFTPDEAIRVFDHTRIDESGKLNGTDLGAIVVDDCIPDGDLSTLGVIEYIRKHFAGPIIAASDHLAFQELLVKAGCCRRSIKDEVPESIFDVFGMLCFDFEPSTP